MSNLKPQVKLQVESRARGEIVGIIGNDSLVSVLGTLVRQRWHWQFQVIIVREMYTRARPNRDDHESLAWHTSLPAESRSVPAARDSTRTWTRLKELETPSHASDSDDLGPPRRRPPRPAGWTSSHLASRHVKLPAAGPGPRLGVAIAVWQRLQGDSDRPQYAEFDEFFCVFSLPPQMVCSLPLCPLLWRLTLNSLNLS